MNNLKKAGFVFLLGGLGGVFAQVLVLPFLVRVNFLGTAVILEKIFPSRPVVTRVEERTIIAPQTGYFSEAIAKAKSSIVAIQSFAGGKLIRSGSGIILTRDGLIATLNSLVPSSASVFQIVNSGKIYKGKIVFRDFGSNVAFISVADNDLTVARLKTDQPDLAENLLIFGHLVSFGSNNPYIASAFVSQSGGIKNSFLITSPYDSNLYGAALVDNEGSVLGIVDFKNLKPTIIASRTITGLLDSFLSKTTN